MNKSSEKRALKCSHFNGVQNNHCEAGVEYSTLTADGEHCLPCLGRTLGGTKPLAECPKFQKQTPEEIEARKKEIQEAMARMVATFPWIASVKARYPRGKGGSGKDACPICRGTIHYSVAAYNGHMHAQCETKGCVNFIE